MPYWTEFVAEENLPRLTLRVWQELLDGGQAFRWNKLTSDSNTTLWQGIWAHNAVRICIGEGHPATVSYLIKEAQHLASARSALLNYLAHERAWLHICNHLPFRSDAVLANAMESFPGLRILRQPFGEALLGFLCSSTKQILQIKQICEQLAQRFGTPIGNGIFAMPEWSRLATVSEMALRECGLGYRARYIAGTAAVLKEYPSWLSEVEAMPYTQAKERLLQLPGVGEKIADCVLLFGCGRLEAFPVDTWILKIMSNAYQLDGWTPAQVAHFGRVHFGPCAGLAQQFLFAHARSIGR